MNIKETAKSITLIDLLDIASPLTLASIIKDIDAGGQWGVVAERIRLVCWEELVSNVGAADALEMVAK
jgi:hypothetical protein